MGATKAQNFEIKEFEFSKLVPSESNEKMGIDNYEFNSLDIAKDFKNNISADVIRSEREHASETGFEILPTVQEHRGIIDQAHEDYEKSVADEVERRLLELKEEAYKEGYQQGYDEGKIEALEKATLEFDEKVQEFSNTIDGLNKDIQKIYSDSKDEAYHMVKNLTKWIILKEVDEKYYLVRLLEKLIHEIHAKSNLVVRVNENAFGYMPEVIKIVERKLGVLTNVRVEVDLDQANNGIILESENTIVDGSLESQFKSIDRLFKNVGLDE